MHEVAWDALDHDAAEVDGEHWVAGGEHDDFDDYHQYMVWAALDSAMEEFRVATCTCDIRWKMTSGEAACGRQKVKQ